MNTALRSCGCGCSPCVCTTSTAVGCVADLCVPRPCFFNGQLIGADDLNAVVDYFRAKDAMLAKFVSGWGVLGGLRLGAPAGVRATALSKQTLSPNPQIIAGTVARVSAGVGIDSGGRTLTLCAPRTVDLAALVTKTVAPTTKACSTWFAGVTVPNCTEDRDNQLSASAYWLVAQYTELPARPAPQYSGGGPCDPAPSCNYSRRIEDVQLSLVPSLPPSYFFTGCLDAVTLSVTRDLAVGAPASARLDATDVAALAATYDAVRTSLDAASCLYDEYLIADAITSDLAEACCSTPALVLGQVLFVSNPGRLLDNDVAFVRDGAAVANVPMYTILLDAYPFRRVIPPAALDFFAIAQNACRQSQASTGAISSPIALGAAPASFATSAGNEIFGTTATGDTLVQAASGQAIDFVQDGTTVASLAASGIQLGSPVLGSVTNGTPFAFQSTGSLDISSGGTATLPAGMYTNVIIWLADQELTQDATIVLPPKAGFYLFDFGSVNFGGKTVTFMCGSGRSDPIKSGKIVIVLGQPRGENTISLGAIT